MGERRRRVATGAAGPSVAPSGDSSWALWHISVCPRCSHPRPPPPLRHSHSHSHTHCHSHSNSRSHSHIHDHSHSHRRSHRYCSVPSDSLTATAMATQVSPEAAAVQELPIPGTRAAVSAALATRTALIAVLRTVPHTVLLPAPSAALSTLTQAAHHRILLTVLLLLSTRAGPCPPEKQ